MHSISSTAGMLPSFSFTGGKRLAVGHGDFKGDPRGNMDDVELPKFSLPELFIGDGERRQLKSSRATGLGDEKQ